MDLSLIWDRQPASARPLQLFYNRLQSKCYNSPGLATIYALHATLFSISLDFDVQTSNEVGMDSSTLGPESGELDDGPSFPFEMTKFCVLS
jgi:hypothetical protein